MRDRSLSLTAATVLPLMALALLGARLDSVWAADAPKVAPAAGASGDTDVVIHPEVPIRGGHNILWCATAQLAWDAIAEAVGQRGCLRLDGEKDHEAVEVLNRREFPREAIDSASVAVAGGLVRDGVLARIRDVWSRLYPPGKPPPVIQADPEDAIGFAALRKELLFATPFRVLPEPLFFNGGSRPLRAFGMLDGDYATDWRALAKQVVVYFDAERQGGSRAAAGVVELLPRDSSDRILLSLLGPGRTLEETWCRAWSCVQGGARLELDSPEDLQIPRLSVDVEWGFPEIAGARVLGVSGNKSLRIQERIAFSLNESGVHVDSVMAVTSAIPVRLVFDRPFLIALLRRSATRPYLLAWVGNDAWMESVAPPQTVPGHDLARVVGDWVLDRDATAEAQAKVRVELAGPQFDPANPGRQLTPAEALDRERAELRRRLTSDESRIRVEADGVTRLHIGSRSGLVGALHIVDGRLAWLPHAFSARTPPTFLVLQEGRLCIPGAALVFRRL